MQLQRLYLHGHKSVDDLEFAAGQFTVLFGKNNAGKTNILETIYGAFTKNAKGVIRRTHAERFSNPQGSMTVQLEAGRGFDDQVASAAGIDLEGPRVQVSFTKSGLVLGSHEDYISDDPLFHTISSEWAQRAVATPSPRVLFLDWQVAKLHERAEDAITRLAITTSLARRGELPWLESIRSSEGTFTYRVPARTEALVAQLASLATDLLPDFVDGAVSAHVTAPSMWGSIPKVLLEYDQRGLTQCADPVDAAGNGAARWIAAAVQIALHLMQENPSLTSLRDAGSVGLSGHVLLLDEPEAHLHPAAAESMVRWCHRMVDNGFTVVAASHHESFLRAAGNGASLVHVTRDPDLVNTSARTLPTTTSTRLQELASDVGMHPASILSLHRGVLFVEGPLDEAVLEEYAGLALEAAGVKILPIHGTKNLEGIVDSEVVTELGIKIGVFTDATDPVTMATRSGRKRSSEERKLIKILEIAERKGLPQPTVFGVTEADLLFALPEDAIREIFATKFPGWPEMVAECRTALGKGPSDSVNWKVYASEEYGLPIDSPGGVRVLVRELDLMGVHLPSLRRVVDEIVQWATS
ncbi:ATP-dependent endonuclease [Rhodococcus sp. NCIMB 12038]|uniref:ATP-dependent nuclease n=1 Tax=Rhodococcus sp. NCIMB 12038 TaxID=933800 RepID=UPI000B3C11D2|nr:TOPRIM nucleotidyl transferase/hydrolase domain-containing protein [Rhodococcus sp. NCIMB 12038]OUS94590.1 hypothetical protein CA951_16845 [Rhodococcus sp. NCIMB 12038]